MKIEVGKSYRTRDGRKAEVLFIGTKPVMYPVIYDAGRGFYEACTLNGRQNLLGMESHADLISEWSDPTPFEQAREAWRNGASGGVEEFFWNAATEHAARCVDRIHTGGTACERVLESVSDAIRKAKV